MFTGKTPGPKCPIAMTRAALVFALAASTAAGCGDRTPRAEIAEAMERYQAAARTVNPDSMAAFYTSTATLFEPGIPPIVGHDAIRAFLASFPGARVDLATAVADTIEIHGAMALYWGHYHEKLEFPGQPPSDQEGKFVAQWVRAGDGRWLIERMYRIPLPTPPPPTAR